MASASLMSATRGAEEVSCSSNVRPRRKPEVYRGDLLTCLDIENGGRIGLVRSPVKLRAIRVLQLRITRVDFRIDSKNGVVIMSHDHNIPAWLEAEAIAATRISRGTRSGEQRSLLPPEARSHCHDLDTSERIAIFVDHHA